MTTDTGVRARSDTPRSPLTPHQTSNELTGFTVGTAAAPERPGQHFIAQRCPSGHHHFNAKSRYTCRPASLAPFPDWNALVRPDSSRFRPS